MGTAGRIERVVMTLPAGLGTRRTSFINFQRNRIKLEKLFAETKFQLWLDPVFNLKVASFI